MRNVRLSRFLTRLESLSALRFIFLVGAIAGALQSIPIFFHTGSANVANARFGQLIVAFAVAVSAWVGAALLWWLAVRRRQFSVWQMALQATLGLAVADILVSGLGLVAGSIETNGTLVIALSHSLSRAVWSPIGLTLIRSCFWFVEAFVLIAVGRRVVRIDTLVAA